MSLTIMNIAIRNATMNSPDALSRNAIVPIPTRTRKSAIAYMSMATFRCEARLRSSRWWLWSASACMTFVPSASPEASPDIRLKAARTVRRTIASAVSNIGTPMASMGTMTDTIKESPVLVINDTVDRKKPRNMAPVSPRNTDAGLKL